MAALSNYLERALLNHVYRNIAYAPPTTVYIGLFSGDPGEAGTSAPEITGNGYARTAVTFKAPAATGDPGPVRNNEVTFPTATPNGWGLVTHFGVFDAASGGNMLSFAPLQNAKTVGAGDTFRYPSDNIAITFD